MSFCASLVPVVEKWSLRILAIDFIFATVLNTVGFNAGDGSSFFARCYVAKSFLDVTFVGSLLLRDRYFRSLRYLITKKYFPHILQPTRVAQGGWKFNQ